MGARAAAAASHHRAELDEGARLRDAIGSVALEMSRELEWGRAVETALRAIESALRADAVGLWTADVEARILHLIAHRSLPGPALSALQEIPYDATLITARAAREERIQVVERLGDLPGETLASQLGKRTGMQGLVAAPLQARGHLVGVMLCLTRSPRRYSEAEIAAILNIADILGLGLDNAKLHTELERTATQLRRINAELMAISTRCHDAAEEAEERAVELEAIIENMNEGVLVSDPELRIRRFNRRELELLGLSSREAMPETVPYMRNFRPRTPEGRPMESDELPGPRALRGETFSDLELVVDAADGRERHLMVAGSPVRDAHGRIVLAVTLARDITEMRRSEREREDWIRMVSHDLRGPLTVVLGQAQILLRVPERREVVEKCGAAIVASARRMNTMIGDLTDAARLEMGKLQPKPAKVDPREFVGAHLAAAGGALDTSRIRVEAPQTLPSVLADPDWLARVLDNYLSNALKYSAPGTQVVVALETRDGEVACEVTDQGPGIPPEDLAHLFERYYRGSSSSTKKEGLGLGLYITRLFVEKMGGRVWATSQVGRGSTFGFSLPRAD